MSGMYHLFTLPRDKWWWYRKVFFQNKKASKDKDVTAWKSLTFSKKSKWSGWMNEGWVEMWEEPAWKFGPQLWIILNFQHWDLDNLHLNLPQRFLIFGGSQSESAFLFFCCWFFISSLTNASVLTQMSYYHYHWT